MTLKITISNTVNTVSNDGETGFDVLPFFYEGVSFSFDITFMADDGNEPPNSVSITSVSLSESPPFNGITITTIDSNPSAYTVRISGPVTGMFSESWDFIMPDLSLQQLPPNTTQTFLALVEWHPPPAFSIDSAWTFALGGYGNYSTGTRLLYSYTSSLNYLQTLSAGGIL
jgi:hypothetical protein